MNQQIIKKDQLLTDPEFEETAAWETDWKACIAACSNCGFLTTLNHRPDRCPECRLKMI